MTREQAKDQCGQCSLCGEFTSLLEPCCGAPVFFEGAFYSLEDFEEDEAS